LLLALDGVHIGQNGHGLLAGRHIGTENTAEATGMPRDALKRALATEGGGVVRVVQKNNSGGHPVGTKWYARFTPIPDRLCVIDRCRKCVSEYYAAWKAGQSTTKTQPTMELVDKSQRFRTTTLKTIQSRRVDEDSPNKCGVRRPVRKPPRDIVGDP